MNVGQEKQVLEMLADYPKLKARVEELEGRPDASSDLGEQVTASYENIKKQFDDLKKKVLGEKPKKAKKPDKAEKKSKKAKK